MKLPVNKLKHALKSGKRQIGLWSNLKSPMVAEALSYTAFDWVLVDMEHGPNDIGDVVSQLQSMAAGEVSPIVRPPWNDKVIIKRLLDAGVQSLVIPYIQNVDEARAAIAATRYPPEGVRGVAGGNRAMKFGLVESYHAQAANELCVILQVETPDAVDQIEAIATIEGVDAIFVGPADLAASMGHLGNFNHPEVQEKIAEAAKRIKAAGKASGILSFNVDQAKEYLDLGYQFVAVGSDQTLLMNAAVELANKFEL
ncbi:MAG: HpcH/HpaI aldolase/citrate lyase family protein [Salaquimonas sp.]